MPSRAGLIQVGRRVIAGMLLVAGAAPLVVLVSVVMDTRAFEYPFIYRLLGWSGVLIVLVLVSGLAIHCWRCVRVLTNSSLRLLPAGIPGWAGFIVWMLVALWCADWVLLSQDPVSRRGDLQYDSRLTDVSAATTTAHGVPADAGAFQITMARVVANRPCDYTTGQIATHVPSIAMRYEVEPALLYFWLYLGSYYGEALSGRVPFLRGMTSETIRDFAQLHLPGWVVESALRRHLIGRQGDGQLLGKPAWKWQYAVQKATYDSSVEPFDTNVYTDIFVVMRAYRSEFPELLAMAPGSSQIDSAIHLAFAELEATLMPGDVLAWESEPAWDSGTYSRLRGPLKSFARGVFYKMLFDLEFATRVQALVARHYDDRFRQALGDEYWSRVPSMQKVVMYAMMRDVYLPGVGHASANLYNLPEFNLAPLRYMIGAVRADPEGPLAQDSTWQPPEAEALLWGGTTKLRVLSEFWQLYYGHPLPGIEPTRTLAASAQVAGRAANSRCAQASR